MTKHLVSSDGLKATLILGDCLDLLPMACDAVVTDPPYGIYACGGKWGHKAELYWDKEAANVAGRHFIGIEKDPHHFATAVARLEHEISQGVFSFA